MSQQVIMPVNLIASICGSHSVHTGHSPRRTLLKHYGCLAVALLVSTFLAGCGDSSELNQVPEPIAHVAERIEILPAGMRADIVVYGATPSGIAATIQAARQGKSVILLEETGHIGGMSASGVSVSDIGKLDTIGGVAREFFSSVWKAYGSANTASLGGTVHEPHVAEAVFASMLPNFNVRLVLGAELSSVNKSGARIVSISVVGGLTYAGEVFVDASYEGDLLAAAGVSYTVGREANSKYGEVNNGVGKSERMIGQAVDPYITPGVRSSGLIRLVQDKALGPTGSADSSVMAYNYRLCLTDNTDNLIPIEPPVDYDASEFELLARLAELLVQNRADHRPPLNYFVTLAPLPNSKFELNAAGAPSTDYVGMSEKYPDATSATRRQIDAEHRRYTTAFLYFLKTSPRIPDYVRNHMSRLGLCKDEFIDSGGWPYRLYLREGRRMIGNRVLTEHDIDGRTLVDDSIGIGSFYYDSHYYNRTVEANTGKAVVVERNDNGFVDPYPISYQALVPKPLQATNLLVSVCVSASHSAFTSLRVEPTYMIMGQAAGAAAALAVEAGVSVQDVQYNRLRSVLLSSGQIL